MGGAAFSYGGWINSIGHPKGLYQHIFNKRTGGNIGLFWDIYMYANSEKINSEIAGQSFSDVPTEIKTLSWHHIMFTRDDTGLAILYIDGKPIKTQSAPGDSSNNHSFNIGSLAGYLDQSFYGSIDEVVIYNRALNPSEVESLYLAGKRAIGGTKKE